MLHAYSETAFGQSGIVSINAEITAIALVILAQLVSLKYCYPTVKSSGIIMKGQLCPYIPCTVIATWKIKCIASVNML